MNPISKAVAKAVGVIALAIAGAIGSYAASLSRTATAYAELAEAVNGIHKEMAKQSERVAKLEGYVEAVKSRPVESTRRTTTAIPIPAPPAAPISVQQKFSPRQMPNRLDELLLESKK